MTKKYKKHEVLDAIRAMGDVKTPEGKAIILTDALGLDVEFEPEVPKLVGWQVGIRWDTVRDRHPGTSIRAWDTLSEKTWMHVTDVVNEGVAHGFTEGMGEAQRQRVIEWENRRRVEDLAFEAVVRTDDGVVYEKQAGPLPWKAAGPFESVAAFEKDQHPLTVLFDPKEEE